MTYTDDVLTLTVTHRPTVLTVRGHLGRGNNQAPAPVLTTETGARLLTEAGTGLLVA